MIRQESLAHLGLHALDSATVAEGATDRSLRSPRTRGLRWTSQARTLDHARKRHQRGHFFFYTRLIGDRDFEIRCPFAVAQDNVLSLIGHKLLVQVLGDLPGIEFAAAEGRDGQRFRSIGMRGPKMSNCVHKCGVRPSEAIAAVTGNQQKAVSGVDVFRHGNGSWIRAIKPTRAFSPTGAVGAHFAADQRAEDVSEVAAAIFSLQRRERDIFAQSLVTTCKNCAEQHKTNKQLPRNRAIAAAFETRKIVKYVLFHFGKSTKQFRMKFITS